MAADQLPDLIGPYRLGERLGAGGMGEVYRGYDARLDRSIALKRVRPEVGDPEKALRRFRREARAAARLRHPGIVQVYDWVETKDEAWLVMEMVEGRSLRDVLHAGPLDPERVVCLARDLLEGLAVAHDAGFVHRDLKASNVMVLVESSSGRGRGERAKILDFGLAKKVQFSEESHLSEDGKIIGTLSAMAPEQVLGQAVDARTDLFALGCLLYEALTGNHPFLGTSAGETLNSICNVYPSSVKERRPSLPESLSAFVDALLQKDPRRRPQSAAAALEELDRVSRNNGALDTLAPGSWSHDGLSTHVEDAIVEEVDVFDPSGQSVKRPWRFGAVTLVVTLLVVGLGVLASFWQPMVRQAGADPIYVAVPSTQVEMNGDHDAELGSRAIHTALVQGLIDLQGVIALEVPSDAPVETQELAREMAADEVLVSRLDCVELGCRALLRRVLDDGSVLWTQDFAAEPRRPLDLSEAVLGYLASAYPKARRRPEAADFEVRPSDYESYLRLLQRHQSRDQGLTSERLLEELEQLSETSPDFVGIPVLAAHVALQRFHTSRAPRDAEKAAAALEQALRVAPQDPRVLMLGARVARQADELDVAEELLQQVRQLEPGYAEGNFQLALLNEERGNGAQAIELAREAVSRWPSPYLLFNSSDILYRQGDFESAREFIERGLERVPDRYDGLSRLAQLELMHGDLERAATLYERLVEISPEETELTNLGTALMMLGSFDEARACFFQVLERSPSSPFAALNLADVTMLLGDAENAARLYRRVLEIIAESEPGRLQSVRAQALAHLGRKEAAVEAIQAAIRQRPEHPWTAYEAAVVYTLIDDRTSALWNARRALTAGIEPRWFNLAWFEPIRGALDTELQRLSDETSN